MEKQVWRRGRERVTTPQALIRRKLLPQTALRRVESGTPGHQGGVAKQVVAPTARRSVAHYVCGRGLSQRQAGALVGLARGSYAPPSGGGRGGIQPADAGLVTRLRALVKQHGGWGFWKYDYRLRKLKVVVKHKRLWRIHQLLRLQAGKRRKKETPARAGEAALAGAHAAQRVLVIGLHERRADRRPPLSHPERGRRLKSGSARYRGGFFAAGHAGRGIAHRPSPPPQHPGPHPGGQWARAYQPRAPDLVSGPGD